MSKDLYIYGCGVCGCQTFYLARNGWAYCEDCLKSDERRSSGLDGALKPRNGDMWIQTVIHRNVKLEKSYIAEMLDVSMSTVYKMLKDGRLRDADLSSLIDYLKHE